MGPPDRAPREAATTLAVTMDGFDYLATTSNLWESGLAVSRSAEPPSGEGLPSP